MLEVQTHDNQCSSQTPALFPIYKLLLLLPSHVHDALSLQEKLHVGPALVIPLTFAAGTAGVNTEGSREGQCNTERRWNEK